MLPREQQIPREDPENEPVPTKQIKKESELGCITALYYQKTRVGALKAHKESLV